MRALGQELVLHLEGGKARSPSAATEGLLDTTKYGPGLVLDEAYHLQASGFESRPVHSPLYHLVTVKSPVRRSQVSVAPALRALSRAVLAGP